MVKQTLLKELNYPVNVFYAASEICGHLKIDSEIYIKLQNELTFTYKYIVNNTNIFTDEEIYVLIELYKDYNTQKGISKFHSSCSKLSSTQYISIVKHNALSKIFCIMYILSRIHDIEYIETIIKNLCNISTDQDIIDIPQNIKDLIIMIPLEYFAPFLNNDIIAEILNHKEHGRIIYTVDLSNYSISEVNSWELFKNNDIYFKKITQLMKLCGVTFR